MILVKDGKHQYSKDFWRNIIGRVIKFDVSIFLKNIIEEVIEIDEISTSSIAIRIRLKRENNLRPTSLIAIRIRLKRENNLRPDRHHRYANSLYNLRIFDLEDEIIWKLENE